MREVSMFLIASFLILLIGPASTGIALGQQLPATPSSSELRLQEILRNIPAEVERYSNLNGEADPFSGISIPPQEASTSWQSDQERLRENLRLLSPYTVVIVNVKGGSVNGEKRAPEKFKGRLVEVTEEGFTVERKSRWRQGRWNSREFSFDQVESVELPAERTRAAKMGIGVGVVLGSVLALGLTFIAIEMCLLPGRSDC